MDGQRDPQRIVAEVTITKATIRALEYVSMHDRARRVQRLVPPTTGVLASMLADRLVCDDPTTSPPVRLTDFGRAVLEAYRLGRRRWGASGR